MWNHCQSSCPLACCKSRQESLPTINESTILIIRDQVFYKTIDGVLVSQEIWRWMEAEKESQLLLPSNGAAGSDRTGLVLCLAQ